jgi:hypothetical protein
MMDNAVSRGGFDDLLPVDRVFGTTQPSVHFRAPHSAPYPRSCPPPVAMQFSIHPSFTRTRACFTVIAAPERVLLPALDATLRQPAGTHGRRGTRMRREGETPGPNQDLPAAPAKAQYLAGEEVDLFRRLVPVHHRIRLGRVGCLQELIAAIGASSHPLILIEYDRAWFAGVPDAIGPFVHACRETAHETGATVLLLATRTDACLLRIADGADRAVINERLVLPRGGRRIPRRMLHGGSQTTLDGVR